MMFTAKVSSRSTNRRYLVAMESQLGEQRQCVLHDWQRLHLYGVPSISFHSRIILGWLLHVVSSCHKRVKQKFI